MSEDLNLRTSANWFALASIGCSIVALVIFGLLVDLLSVALATTALQRARAQHTSPTPAYVAYGIAIVILMTILILGSGVL